MNKRVLDILSFVMKEIRENSYGDIDLQLIMDILSTQGFSDDEISSAMSWLMSHGESIDRLFTGHPAGVPRPMWRILNEYEKEIISPQAYSYLFHLRELDLLSDDEMEKIIERATSLQMAHLDEKEMQDLIAAVVLDFENSASEGYFQFNSTMLPH